jgi:hypothetical protein
VRRPVACVLKMLPRCSETFLLEVSLARARDIYGRNVGRLRVLVEEVAAT